MNQPSTASSQRTQLGHRLRTRTAPAWLPWLIGVLAVILGAAASALIGFGIASWAIFSALILVIAGPLAVAGIEGRRRGADAFARYLVWGAFLLALVPLVSVLWVVLARGLPGLNAHLLTTSMGGVTGVTDNAAAAGEGPVYGGAYHAIVGTLVITFWATVMSVPIGLLTAIYLTEYGGATRISRAIAKTITFLVDVMTGIPSIVAGLFIVASLDGSAPSRLSWQASHNLNDLIHRTATGMNDQDRDGDGTTPATERAPRRTAARPP